MNTETEALPTDHGWTVCGDEDRPQRRVGDCRTVTVSLTEEETQCLLNETNHAYNTDINDLLLAALILVLREQLHVGKVLINLEAHGREEIFGDIDVTRTVGWFTTQFPVILETCISTAPVPSEAALSHQIRSVKETLRRVPNKGIGYGILRYLTPHERRGGRSLRVEPAISFNYLGQFDEDMRYDVFTMSPCGTGRSVGLDVESPYRLETNGLIANGRLAMLFTYSGQEYEEQTIQKLADAYRAYLIRIIEHCRKETGRPTPSDLGDSDLSLGELDYIAALFETERETS